MYAGFPNLSRLMGMKLQPVTNETLDSKLRYYINLLKNSWKRRSRFFLEAPCAIMFTSLVVMDLSIFHLRHKSVKSKRWELKTPLFVFWLESLFPNLMVAKWILGYLLSICQCVWLPYNFRLFGSSAFTSNTRDQTLTCCSCSSTVLIQMG